MYFLETYGELLTSIFESKLFYWFYILSGILLFVMGIIMYIGIKKKGKVILISWLLRHKQHDNEELKSKYIIQAFYTSFFGALLFTVTITKIIPQLTIFYIVLFIALFDGLYDFYAIKKSIKKQEEVN